MHSGLRTVSHATTRIPPTSPLRLLSNKQLVGPSEQFLRAEPKMAHCSLSSSGNLGCRSLPQLRKTVTAGLMCWVTLTQ